MKNTFLILIIIVGMAVLGISNAQADDTNTLVSATANYWMPSIDATIRSSDLSVIGTDIDFVNDLGLDDSKSIPSFKASVDLPLFPEIFVSYFKIDSDAEKTLTKSIVYDATTYVTSSVVSSSYDITHYEALLGLPLINNDFAKLEPLLGAKYFKVDTALSSAGVSQSDSVKGPVPVVGLMGEIRLPAKFRLEGFARGLDLDINDIKAKLYDIEGAVHYDFNRFLRASAGYRYFMIKAEDKSTDDSVDIKFTGPYVGVTGSF